MLHGLCCGEEAGARNLVFFRVKWLQAAMKGTSCVCGGCGCGRFAFFFAAVERWLQAVVAVPACVCVVIGCEVWDVKSAVRSVKCGV